MTDATYTAKSEAYFEGSRGEMTPFIPDTCVRMLEIGCGNAAFAKHLKSQRDIHVTAIESHPAAAVVAKQRVDRLLQHTLDEGLTLLAGEEFDCIVMNDVIEHLVDPWKALERLHQHLSSHGRLVASIPNVRYAPVLKEYLQEAQWRYRSDGVMDRTHLRFFTKRSMKDLFESTGYRTETIIGINGMNLPWKLNLLNKLTNNSLDDARFRQFACVVSKHI